MLLTAPIDDIVRSSRRWLLCVALPVVATAAGAQGGTDSTCRYSDRPGRTIRVALPGGYRAELKRDASDSTSEFRCSIAVRNARDSLAWAGRGFNTMVDAWTGRDIDGDGTPDAALGIDTGGGNRCCWGFTVLRLTPSFRVVGELGFNAIFSADTRGRTVIYELVPFYDLSPGMSDAPSIARVHQYRGATLTDVTREFCTRMLTDTTNAVGSLRHDWDRVTPASRAASRAATDTSKVTYEITQTRLAAMSLVMQHIVCGRDVEAARLANDTWPATQAAQVLERLRQRVSSAVSSRT